jgi:hypothetical protein
MKFSGSFENKAGNQIDVSFNFVIFKQEDVFVLYAPALEVYGYGKSEDEARDSFVTCMEEFLDYTIAKGTLFSELKRLGWKMKGRKSNRKFSIPDFSELLRNNQRLIDILNTNEVRTYRENMHMPVPA